MAEPQRQIVTRALAAALVLHATILVAKIPNWGPKPVRVDAPQAQSMKVQFLRPPPPPPTAPPQEPQPVTKKVPRPDPTPDEPEPVKAAPPPPAPSISPAPAQDMGPIRVSPGQGPGLIKKVEPRYPPIAQTARIEGEVVVDAVIRKDGMVSDVTVLRSTNTLFDQACIDAVRQWRFTPGSQDVVLTVTVRFTLR